VNVNAMCETLADKLWLFGGYRTDTQIYFLADRLIEKERFYVLISVLALGSTNTLGLDSASNSLLLTSLTVSFFKGQVLPLDGLMSLNLTPALASPCNFCGEDNCYS